MCAVHRGYYPSQPIRAPELRGRFDTFTSSVTDRIAPPVAARKGALCGLCLALVVTFASTAEAEPTPEQKLEALREEIAQVQQQLKRKGEALSTSEQALERIEQELATTRRQLTSLARDATRLGEELSDLEARRETLRGELAQHRELLLRQVRMAYLMGHQERVKLILNQEDPQLLNRILRYHDYISHARRAQMQIVSARVESLNRVNDDIRQRSAALARAREESTVQQTLLQSQAAERKTVLEELLAEMASDQQRLTTMNRNEQELVTLIDRLRRHLDDIPDDLGGTFAASRGTLPWPISGTTLNRFGESRNAGRLRWNGTVLSARAGTEVRSIYPGRVIFADWLRGFGLLLIIDHGADYMTLYGYNAALYKAVGDWVGAGETVALVGDSGGQSQASLYFEIRSNGKPLDPANWCRSG